VLRLLFICSRNRWRSPTAEQVFSARPGVECASAGLTHDAENPVTPELLRWADLILVMEQGHKVKLQARFKSQVSGKRVVCLGIPDKFKYMDPRLVELLEAKVNPFIPA
jgi:predicted protein tyrosine phosphatase